MKSTDYQQPAADAATAQIAERGRLSDFSQLIKARLTFLVLVTTGVGFYVGTRGPVDLVRLFNVLVGAALGAAGGSALNRWWDGGSSRFAQFRGLDFVRDRLRLANPALLRHRLALSSRLRAGRISHALERR